MSGVAEIYSRNKGGFSSKVSVSISRTVLRPSEIYLFNSWQAWKMLEATSHKEKNTYMLEKLKHGYCGGSSRNTIF